MKKKSLLATMLVFFAFSLVACGNSAVDDNNEKTEKESSKDDDNKDDESEEKESKKDKKKDKKDDEKSSAKEFKGVIETYEMGEYYNVEAYTEAELILGDGNNCTYINSVVYADNVDQKKYAATYETMDGGYVVSYFDGYDYVDAMIYVNDSDIVKVADQYSSSSDFSDIIGKYSLDTEIGQVVFEVDENGIVDSTVSVENKKYDTASLFMYDHDGDGDVFDPEWDLTFSIGETCYDWYIYFARNSVTYVPYKQAIYGPFEGTYTMDGELGVLTIDVDNEGNAYAAINIDGTTYDFDGSLYYDYYENQITFDLTSDNVSLYLYLDRFEDGDWYQGYYTITKQLAAG